MKELTLEQSQYLSDDMYLPISYKGIIIEQPSYWENENYSNEQLKAICKQFNEYCKQQLIIKQNCKRHFIETKFGLDWKKDYNWNKK